MLIKGSNLTQWEHLFVFALLLPMCRSSIWTGHYDVGNSGGDTRVYPLVTDGGRVLTRLIASETSEAVVSRMAEGKEQTIGRGEIEEIRAPYFANS